MSTAPNIREQLKAATNSALPADIVFPTGELTARMPDVPAAPKFSVIMCTHEQQKAQQALQYWQKGLQDIQAQTPAFPVLGPKSMCAGYNLALKQVTTPYVIFAHHDAFPLPFDGYFIGKKLEAHLRHADVVGFAGSNRLVSTKWFSAGAAYTFGQVVNIAATPNQQPPIAACLWERPARLVIGVKLLDGYCIVVKTDVAKEIGWDENTFTDFHLYDLDFALSAAAKGKKIAVATDTYICHASHGSYQLPVWAVEGEKFMKKWKGHADLSRPDVQGFAQSTVNGGDLRMIIRVLEEMAERLPEVCILKN
jgi:hypothetical protein